MVDVQKPKDDGKVSLEDSVKKVLSFINRVANAPNLAGFDYVVNVAHNAWSELENLFKPEFFNVSLDFLEDKLSVPEFWFKARTNVVHIVLDALLTQDISDYSSDLRQVLGDDCPLEKFNSSYDPFSDAPVNGLASKLSDFDVFIRNYVFLLDKFDALDFNLAQGSLEQSHFDDLGIFVSKLPPELHSVYKSYFDDLSKSLGSFFANFELKDSPKKVFDDFEHNFDVFSAFLKSIPGPLFSASKDQIYGVVDSFVDYSLSVLDYLKDPLYYPESENDKVPTSYFDSAAKRFSAFVFFSPIFDNVKNKKRGFLKKVSSFKRCHNKKVLDNLATVSHFLVDFALDSDYRYKINEILEDPDPGVQEDFKRIFNKYSDSFQVDDSSLMVLFGNESWRYLSRYIEGFSHIAVEKKDEQSLKNYFDKKVCDASFDLLRIVDQNLTYLKQNVPEQPGLEYFKIFHGLYDFGASLLKHIKQYPYLKLETKLLERRFSSFFRKFYNSLLDETRSRVSDEAVSLSCSVLDDDSYLGTSSSYEAHVSQESFVEFSDLEELKRVYNYVPLHVLSEYLPFAFDNLKNFCSDFKK